MGEHSKLNACAYVSVFLFSFVMAFSMPTGRAFLAIALLFLLADLINKKKLPVFSISMWIALAFVLLAVWTTFHGANPELGVRKLRKLYWFLGIPVIATLVASRGNVLSLLAGYTMGAGVLSIRNICISVTRGFAAERAGDPGFGFYEAVVDAGSMTDAQRLMLAILVTTGFILLCRKEKARTVGWWALLLLQIAALIFSFKRGSWICTSAVVGLFMLLKTNWKYWLLTIAVGLIILSLPFCRNRISELREEFNTDGGGRLTMWTKVVPGLRKDYPRGVGIRSLTNDMMRKYAPEVEKNRDHVHSNPLQILVATGVFGLILYSLWMLASLTEILIALFLARERSYTNRTAGLLMLLMFLALLLNGLVEYNFLDGEIVLVYCLLMGSSAGLLKYYTALLAEDTEPATCTS